MTLDLSSLQKAVAENVYETARRFLDDARELLKSLEERND